MRVVTVLLGSLVFSGAAFADGPNEGAAPGYELPIGSGFAFQLLRLDRHLEALEERLAEQFADLQDRLDALEENEPGTPTVR